MKTLAELRARAAEIVARMRAINDEAGDADLTEEQTTEWDALVEERSQVDGQIKQREDRAAEILKLADKPGHTEPGDGARAGAPEVMRKVEPFDGTDVRTLSRSDVRSRSLKALEDKDRSGHMRSDSLDKVDRLLRTRTGNFDGGHVARMLLASETDEYHSAFAKAMTQAQPAFTPEEARAINAVNELRGMSGGTDTAGGFAVPVLIDPTIILTAQGSLNPFRKIARVETITTDEWKGVSSAGVTWSYDAEAAAVSDDSPTVAQPSVVSKTARGFIQYSIEIDMDWPGFAQNMAMLLGEGYDELQASSFATGNGTTQPRGILTALDANTNVEVSVTTDGAFGGVDINKVWGALPDRWKGNATWVMNHDVGNEVATFGNGNNLSFVTVNLEGMLQTLRMRPVEFASYFPDFVGTTGAANILVVGDFRNFVIADRAGMTVELVQHVFDITNNRPTGERGWFAWARHGSNSINDLGFRLLQNT